MSMINAYNARSAFLGPLAGGVMLLAATALLVPNRAQIADAVRRATFTPPPVPTAPAAPSSAVLMQRYKEGARLSSIELEQLLRASIATAPAHFLSTMASTVERSSGSVSTAQITYDILAHGRVAEALAFLESRPDAGASALWPLRFDLHRKLGDVRGARALVRAAALAPGTAMPHELVSAAYAMSQPELLVIAAETGALPRLSRSQSLDLASFAHEHKRYDLISRIDKAGTPSWRDDNPWLAMTTALHFGDVSAALRYADQLPAGAKAARETIVMGSKDSDAIRRLLMDKAAQKHTDRVLIAGQLLDRGFRTEAVSVLKTVSAPAGPQEAAASRMLYLMGPRPRQEDLDWLRSHALTDPRWLGPYLEREEPARALAFLESRRDADATSTLLRRITFAHEARDEKGSSRALDRLLDGRPLDASQLKNASLALASPTMLRRYGLALSKARVRAGAEAPSDRLDLAWDAWNRGKAQEAADQLRPYLEQEPADMSALQLMASIQGKLGGKGSERPWLERLLRLTPTQSRERATVLARLGRRSEAITLLEQLREQSPGDRQLSIQLSRLLVSAGDPGRARKVLQP